MLNAPTAPLRDRASALLLFPAGFLVMIVLAAIAFDLSIVWLRQQQARSVASGVANDAVTAALDHAAWRATGDYVLDPDRARSLAIEAIDASDIAAYVVDVDVRTQGATIRIGIALEVPYVFGGAIPGSPDSLELRVDETATAVRSFPRLCNSSHASCRIPG